MLRGCVRVFLLSHPEAGLERKNIGESPGLRGTPTRREVSPLGCEYIERLFQ